MHEWLLEGQKIARAAADTLLMIYNRTEVQVEMKADSSPLTQADLAAHHDIVTRLQALTPDIPILSEESQSIDYDQRRDWATFWLVDPLDGTREFIQRNGEFTINIALVHAHRPVLGVVHIPVRQVTYGAAEGQGAFKTDGNDTVTLQANQSLGATLQVVASRSHAGADTRAFLDNLRQDYDLKVVSKGSALKLCMVAEGSADLYPRLGPTMEWDTAAAQCVVEQAGGHVTTLEGEPLRYNKENLLNPFFMVASPATASLWRRYLRNQSQPERGLKK
ncbi:3'(2'),5'-bisphosphate nucleotidase CysQ [Candidatus Entotheonellaceae bacterium PAL068K]